MPRSNNFATSGHNADYFDQVAALRRDTAGANRLFATEIARVNEQIRDLSAPQLAEPELRSADADPNITAARQLQRYQAGTEHFRRLCAESIPRAVPEMKKQRISDVSATGNSVAHVGSFNELAGAAKADQDISQIRTKNKSLAIIGTANGIDFNQLMAKRFK
ncbi:uncharacterized protein PG986_005628 [Apiospora aurea]|uniref:Uncharacterized protein n=1 Tax=Apiospora aurea TaxID=335848 RepID=A0ABR1QI41_9PEZI